MSRPRCPRSGANSSRTASFDGGNIRVIAIEEDGEAARIDLEIVPDKDSEFFQWFYFRAAGLSGRRVTFRILNAGQSAYPMGWPGYRTRASTDLDTWADDRYAV